MGVTLTVALVFWLASSFIEYKLIKNFPALRKIIQHPVGGILLSVAIGFGVGWAIGSAGGLGIFIGQILGLATNSFTFKLYTGLEQLGTATKETLATLKTSWAKNKEAFLQVVDAFRSLFKGLFAILKGIFWVLSTPTRIANFFSKGKAAAVVVK